MSDLPPSRPTAIDGGLGSCWFCGRAVSPRALFCHGCGSIQAPPAADPFTRLNLTRRFDLTAEELERQLAGFTRNLDATRFAGKSRKEQALAAQWRTAVTEAADLLADPVERARTLLALEGMAIPTTGDRESLALDLSAAADAAACSRLAVRLEQQTEQDLRALSTAFRLDDHERAARLVARLEAVQLTLAEAQRRALLAPR